MAVQPLVRVAIDPLIASLPDAGLHRQQEEQAGPRPRPHPPPGAAAVRLAGVGAAPSYGARPVRQFVACGIPVTLSTDLLVHVGATIGREYAIAAALEFSPAALLAFTRHAVKASFTSAERRSALMDELHQWEARLDPPSVADGSA